MSHPARARRGGGGGGGVGGWGGWGGAVQGFEANWTPFQLEQVEVVLMESLTVVVWGGIKEEGFKVNSGFHGGPVCLHSVLMALQQFISTQVLVGRVRLQKAAW